MRIGFFGAAGEVTGSSYLVDTGKIRFLVDCGMFQGGAQAHAKNIAALDFGFDVRQIDFVLITHAHIDHSGLLPRLTVLGYRGPVYATPACVDLLQILLPDSAHIQEKESEWQLRHQHRKDRGARMRVTPPLYTVAQAGSALELLKGIPLGEWLQPAEGIRIRFHEAGHILGSAWIEAIVNHGGRQRRIIFSGDLGVFDRPVLRDPEMPTGEADALLIESTYGNREHRSLESTEEEIVGAFERTRAQGGNLIIPAFAVGRTQEVIYILADLVRRRRLQPLKIYVDSPMANTATHITLSHPELLDTQTRDLLDWVRAHPDQFTVEFVGDANQSRALNDVKSGAVIISASGMCEAGRIKYHLRENLPRSECTVMITGFQAFGTLGRRLVDGARKVTIFGQTVPVRAKIYTVGGLSAHADQPTLLHWLSGFRLPPKQIFTVHGEVSAQEAFVEAIKEKLGWNGIHSPRRGEFFEL
jgi:beta-lactamase-like:RNA-metabolising metallo-beta-lactamase